MKWHYWTSDLVDFTHFTMRLELAMLQVAGGWETGWGHCTSCTRTPLQEDRTSRLTQEQPSSLLFSAVIGIYFFCLDDKYFFISIFEYCSPFLPQHFFFVSLLFGILFQQVFFLLVLTWFLPKPKFSCFVFFFKHKWHTSCLQRQFCRDSFNFFGSFYNFCVSIS